MRRAFLSSAVVFLIALPAIGAVPANEVVETYRIDPSQVPTWSSDDLQFFMHGSMGTEVVPERVLHAFVKIYPELFPAADLTNLGLIGDQKFGWPIGFSRRSVKHLGNLSAIGVNCASCHVAEVQGDRTEQARLILGATSHFDVEQFFGAVSTAANMKKFLAAYVTEGGTDAKASVRPLKSNHLVGRTGRLIN